MESTSTRRVIQNETNLPSFKSERRPTVELTGAHETASHERFREKLAWSHPVQRFVSHRPSGSRRPRTASAERATRRRILQLSRRNRATLLFARDGGHCDETQPALAFTRFQ